jgi:phage terminase large subunit GpA-like protein
MISDSEYYLLQWADIIQSADVPLSNILPSAWVEENVVMGPPFPGPYRYTKTPYCREIIDRLAPDNDARVVAVIKGMQIGVSAGVIIPGLCYIIKEAPGNTYFTVGAPDLINKSVEKLDLMIDNAGLRSYIKPQVQRVRAQKSGDTNTKKDFVGGFINITTPNNHKEWRDVSLRYGFIDDFEAAKAASKESGSTRKLIEGRFAAYADTHKIFYISTPEQKVTSNIEPAFLLGDQRKYMIPCPCCGSFIELRWTIEREGRIGGVTWKTDESNKLIPGSVGYTCQECGEFFDDTNKDDLLNAGHWQPTAEPSKPGYYSYHISSLYAPLGMYDWEHYVNDWLEAHPIGQPRNEALYKTFVNTVLGETYEALSEAPKATAIMRNVRDYEICTIPEKMSIADGNGKIVLVTCAADMNGVVDDCRLDYEIVAWAESGARYSLAHGSIGTFIPRENSLKHKEDREKWTYEEHKERSVWPELEKILATQFPTDTGRKMPIWITGLDCGHYSNYAYAYIDKTNRHVVGLKGDKEDKNIAFGVDVRLFKPAVERAKLYILQVGLLKDNLSSYMGLRWTKDDGPQPMNFMNFPSPSGGLYLFTNYFEHFESEHRTEVRNAQGIVTGFRWMKKASNSQNHMWDCAVYNNVLKLIAVDIIGRAIKLNAVELKAFEWADCARVLQGG